MKDVSYFNINCKMWSYLIFVIAIICSLNTILNTNYDLYWSEKCQVMEDIPDINYEYGLVNGRFPFARLCDPNSSYYNLLSNLSNKTDNVMYTDWSDCISACSVPTNKTGTIFENIDVDYDRNCDSSNSCQLHTIQFRRYIFTNTSTSKDYIPKIIFRECPLKYKWISTVGECQSNSIDSEASLKWKCVDISTDNETLVTSKCSMCHRHKLIKDIKCKDVFIMPNNWATSNWTTCWGNCIKGNQKQYAQCNITDETRCHNASRPFLQRRRRCDFALNDICVHGSPIYRNKWSGLFELSPHTSLLYSIHHNLSTYRDYTNHDSRDTNILIHKNETHQIKNNSINGNCTVLRYCNGNSYRLDQCYTLDQHHCVSNSTVECRVTPLPNFPTYLLSQHCNCESHLNYTEYPCLHWKYEFTLPITEDI
jgi:hypothetical protein